MHEILRILVREGVIGRDRAEELAAVSERDPLSAHPLEAWSEAGLDDIACAECLARVYELHSTGDRRRVAGVLRRTSSARR